MKKNINMLSLLLEEKNPLKSKLVKMETPINNHYIYSFLVCSLFTYCWLFVAILLYRQAYCSIIGLMVMLFASVCLFFTYKKNYLEISKKVHFIIFGFSIIISIILELTDQSDISFSEIGITFLFFINITPKSYLALSILALSMVGISWSFTNSVQVSYKHFCDFQQKSQKKLTVEDIINVNYDLSWVLVLLIPYIIYIAFNTAEDNFRGMLKLVSLVFFLEFPPYFYRCIAAKKYLRLFNAAKKLTLTK